MVQERARKMHNFIRPRSLGSTQRVFRSLVLLYVVLAVFSLVQTLTLHHTTPPIQHEWQQTFYNHTSTISHQHRNAKSSLMELPEDFPDLSNIPDGGTKATLALLYPMGT